tara:strand:+ start:1272 stop:1592 length:321 start_codon:yes stop_codon:yes gene_type:complete
MGNMLTIDDRLEAQEITLVDGNTLPKENRNQRTFKRVIAAVRAAESESNARFRDSERRCQESQEKVIMLMGRNRQLEDELKKHNLQKAMDQAEVPAEKQTRLLEFA